MHFSIPSFADVPVLVVGDLMLDRYWQGSTARISPEAPVPVVRVTNDHEQAGGAGNVAVNLATLGAQANVIGGVGKDEAANSLRQQFEQHQVSHCLLPFVDAPTITKLRVVSRNQQLIRLDFEEQQADLDAAQLQQACVEALPQAQVMILSDYGKGVLVDAQVLIQAARAAECPVLVDPKGTDFERYRGASCITPNLSEFEAVVGVCPTEQVLVEKGQALRAELDLHALLITRSEHGMTLLEEGQPPLHLPTLALDVYDVTGAGDTVIATLAAGVGAGQSWADAAKVANLAAGLVVAKLGTAAVSQAELRLAARQRAATGRGVVSEPELLELMSWARAQGEKVVMTNGCFDILHPGHVAYLEQAAALGDRLIVAVNDDASVKRLKGPERPVNDLQQRMAVLAGLASVDWVVPFAEDTPERLICALLPDLLVKGGDYQPEQIAGHKCVTANGGQVQILDFVDGYSTTGTIDRIQGRE